MEYNGKIISFVKTLFKNGWKPNYDEKYTGEETYKTFEFHLIGISYESRCFAHIAEIPESISINGHLGVAWVSVEYEYNDRPYTPVDLYDMLEAINCAEKNLLAIGIPFQDNKAFHGTEEEIFEKIKRNIELREKLQLDKIEKLYWEAYEKQ